MIKEPELDIKDYGNILDYTAEEVAALGAYKGNSGYKLINSLLSNSGGEYEKRTGWIPEDFLRQNENGTLALEDTIKMVSEIYSAALKSEVKNGYAETRQVLHRGTSVAEINQIREGDTLNTVLSTSDVDVGSELDAWVFINNADAPARMQITCEPRSTYHSCNRIHGSGWWRKRGYSSSFY